MSDFAKTRDVRSVASALAEAAPRGIAESAWPWFAGFLGIVTIFLYREAFRLMMWARSMNW
ncbi:MAG: hypothetical protein WAN10_05090 [Candidatus Acidiferrales bacterium]